MALGLRGLARAVAGTAAACLVAAVAAAVGLGAGAVATAADSSPSWKVTVGAASALLYPGTAATMPIEVRNDAVGTQRLHGTTAVVRIDRAGCDASWFRVVANDIPTDVDIGAGQSVKGTATLRFDNAPVSQDACQNVGVEVAVTAA